MNQRKLCSPVAINNLLIFAFANASFRQKFVRIIAGSLGASAASLSSAKSQAGELFSRHDWHDSPGSWMPKAKIDIGRVTFASRHVPIQRTVSTTSPELHVRFFFCTRPCSVSRSIGLRKGDTAKKIRERDRSWQGRAPAHHERMLFYAGNTSFILRSISASPLPRER